jgi:hypothetical protein
MTRSFTSRDQKDEEAATDEPLLCGSFLAQTKVANYTVHTTCTKEMDVPFYSSSTSMTKMIHVG